MTSETRQATSCLRLRPVLLAVFSLLLFLSACSQAAPLRARRQLDWAVDTDSLQQGLARALGLLETRRAALAGAYGDYGQEAEDEAEEDFEAYEEAVEDALQQAYNEEYEADVAERVKQEIVDKYIKDVIASVAAEEAVEEEVEEEEEEEEEERRKEFQEQLNEYLWETYSNPETTALMPMDDSEPDNFSRMWEERVMNELLADGNNQLDEYLKQKRSDEFNGDLDEYLGFPVEPQDDLSSYLEMPVSDEVLEASEEPVDLDAVGQMLDNIEDKALIQTLDMMSTAQHAGFNADSDPNAKNELLTLDVAYKAEKIKDMIEHIKEQYESNVQEVNEADEEMADSLYKIGEVLETLPLDQLEVLTELVDGIAEEREDEEADRK